MRTRHQKRPHHHQNTQGASKPERGKRMGCKIAQLKQWGAKSHNWEKIGRKVQLSLFFFVSIHQYMFNNDFC